MARFYEVSLRLNSNSGLISHARVLLAILLVTLMQIPLSATVFAEPENPKLRNENASNVMARKISPVQAPMAKSVRCMFQQRNSNKACTVAATALTATRTSSKPNTGRALTAR